MDKLQELRIQHWSRAYAAELSNVSTQATHEQANKSGITAANLALEAFDARFPQVKSTGDLGVMVDTEKPWKDINLLDGVRTVEFKFEDGSTDLGWKTYLGYCARQDTNLPLRSAAAWPLSDKTPTHFREITQ